MDAAKKLLNKPHHEKAGNIGVPVYVGQAQKNVGIPKTFGHLKLVSPCIFPEEAGSREKWIPLVTSDTGSLPALSLSENLPQKKFYDISDMVE